MIEPISIELIKWFSAVTPDGITSLWVMKEPGNPSKWNTVLTENMSDLQIPSDELILSDISVTRHENNDTESKYLTKTEDKIASDSENIIFHRVHRIGTSSTRGSRPFVAKFEHIRQEESIKDFQLVVIKEVLSECGLNPNQKDSEHPNIKEEQEELWISEKRLNRLQEAEIISFPFTTVSVKSEDDEDKPLSSQLQQRETGDHSETEVPSSSAEHIKTESDREDCGGSGPVQKQNPDSHQEAKTEEQISDSSETDNSDDWQEPLSDVGPETENSDSSWTENRAHKSNPSSVNYMKTPESDLRTNSQKKSHICFECGKEFQVKWSLQKHMIGHSGRESSSCFSNNICSRVKQNGDSEIRMQLGEKPFGCEECGKRFNKRQYIEIHMRAHTGEKPYDCDVCGKRFNYIYDLKRHVRIHEDGKPYCCNVCGKRFNFMSNVKTHMRVHTGERPYGCDVCGKRFNYMCDLMTHRRSHTGEKPYGCDVCGKRFNVKSNLNKHIGIHTREKPYVCDVCGKRFCFKQNLKKHVVVHTTVKQYCCDACGKRFNLKEGLKRHMRIHTR